MATVVRLDWGRIFMRGVVAGIVGGITGDLFIYCASVLPAHGSMIGVWQFIASTVIGKAAFADPNTAWLGLALHALVSISWGIGYAYLAQTRPFVNAKPVLSGMVYGLVVYVIMQIVLAADNNFAIPSLAGFVTTIITHTFFFGLPVALTVRAQSK